jgi:hypothetical protein
MATPTFTKDDLAELTRKFQDFLDKLTLAVLSEASPQMKKELSEQCCVFQKRAANMMANIDTMHTFSLQ